MKKKLCIYVLYSIVDAYTRCTFKALEQSEVDVWKYFQIYVLCTKKPQCRAVELLNNLRLFIQTVFT